MLIADPAEGGGPYLGLAEDRRLTARRIEAQCDAQL